MSLRDLLTPILGMPRQSPSHVASDLSRRLRSDEPTRRWFLRSGMSIGAIAALSLFPTFKAARAATTWFVDSGAAGTNAGTSWTNAALTITAGLALVSAGDTILVKNTHAVTAGGAITWTPPAGGVAIISVTPSGGSSYSAFTAGAAESIGAFNNAFTLASAAASGMYCWGLTLNGAVGSFGTGTISISQTNSTSAYLEMVNCTFDLKSTNASGTMVLGTTASESHGIRLRDCTFICSASRTGVYFTVGFAQIDIINPTFSMTGGSKPTLLIQPSGSTTDAIMVIRDGDASGFNTSSGAFLSLTTNQTGLALTFKNLKISATPTLTSGTWPGGIGSFTLRNVDSGNTDYVFDYIDSYGTLTATTATSKNSGGSFNSQAISWQIVTSTLATEFRPFVSPLIQVWDTSTSGQTPTLSVAQATGSTNLNDRTAWFTLSAAASATQTDYTHFSGRNTQPFVGSAVDWAADSGATWTGISSPVKQLLSLGTVTPARAGLLQGRLYIGAASVTVYVNPVIQGIT